ncbi:MAG: hypothetical protein ACLGHN_12140, partial [Bacteriovoracia bacterium]
DSDYLKVKRKESIWRNSASYAVKDNFNVGLGLNYTFASEVKEKDVGTAPLNYEEYSEKGLQNILLNGSYRLMDQTGGQLNLDILATLSIKPGTSEYGYAADASTSSNGNAIDPHHSLEVGARIGKKVSSQFEWIAGLFAEYNFKGKAEGKIDNGSGLEDEDTDYDAHLVTSLLGAVQFRPVEPLMLQFSLNVSRASKYSYEQESSAGKTKITLDPVTTSEIGALARYAVRPNVIINLGGSYSQAQDFDYEIKDSGVNSEVKDAKSVKFVAGADFLF